MKTREDAWYWMAGNIKFSRIDRRFVDSVIRNRIGRLIPASEKQADLWEKLIYKYQRQIRENGIDPDWILSLPWGWAPLPSVPEPTSYKVWVEDTEIRISWPYDNQVLERWKNWRAHRLPDSYWVREKKYWAHSLDVQGIRGFLGFAQRMNKNNVLFHLDDDLGELKKILESWGDPDSWQVRARCVNDSIMISNINDDLLANLPDDLGINSRSIMKLVDMGVQIDPGLRDRALAGQPRPAMDLQCQKVTYLAWNDRTARCLRDFLVEQGWRVVFLISREQKYSQLMHLLDRRLGDRLITVDRSRIDSSEQFKEIFSDDIDLLVSPLHNYYSFGADVIKQKARRILNYVDPESLITKDNP